MINKLGLQLWTVGGTMGNAEDIRSTFRKLKEIGYDMVQTAGCAIPYAEFAKIAEEEGIEICGTHEGFDALYNDPALAMENHRLLKTTNMGIGYHNTSTVEIVEEFIKKANELADIIYPHGFKFTYHHHNDEFTRLANGKTAMDMLTEGLDPVKTSIVLDTYWVQYGGGDVRYWLERLAGRVDILHLKDMGTAEEKPFITEIGNGNLWWDGIIETAVKTGVKYFVVEQDTCPGDPFDSVKKSAEYLKKFMK